MKTHLRVIEEPLHGDQRGAMDIYYPSSSTVIGNKGIIGEIVLDREGARGVIISYKLQTFIGLSLAQNELAALASPWQGIGYSEMAVSALQVVCGAASVHQTEHSVHN